MTTLKRLLVPFIVFIIFLIIAYLSEDILMEFGTEAISQSLKVFAHVVQIGIWLSAAFLVNRLCVVFLWDGIIRRTLGGPVPRLLRDFTSVLIYLVAITGIISFVFGKPVTGIWATSGAVGLVIGFALQSMILDIFTGLAINIDRPYKLGDWIVVHDKQRYDDRIYGQIQEVNWRTTRIRTRDGNIVVIPNSVMGQSIITNHMTPEPLARQKLVFCLDYSVPPERAARILLAGVKAVIGPGGPRPKPEPVVRIAGTNSTGVEYWVRYWIKYGEDAPGLVRHSVAHSILEHLQHTGIMLAYEKLDVYHAEMPSRQLDTQSIEDRTKLLERIELFSSLQKTELQELATNMNQRVFKDKEKLIKAGDHDNSMFILVEGFLEVFADVKNNGEEVKVGRIKPGQFFGEMSLLTGEARSATIIAATETVAYEITKDHVDSILRKRPAIADTVSRVIAERKLMNSKVLENATQAQKKEQTDNMAQQIMSKMREFFKGVF